MSDTAVIILFVLLAILLVGVLVLLFVLLKNRKAPIGSDQQSLGEVKARIDALDREMEKSIEVILSREMVKLTKEFGNNTEKSQQNLGHFQSEITEFLQKRIDSLNKQMEEKINLLDKKVDDKLKEGFQGTTETISQVRERLKVIDEAQKQMEGLGKEVVSLKSVLEGNQRRGQYGEYQLEMVLHNVFGDTIGCYELQHTMKKVHDGDDVRADAVVFMPEPNKMICIDSKFPFQSYSKLFEATDDNEKEALKRTFAADVKKHITAIKDKYIVEGKTAPEAMMFIPNDGVFAYIHHELQEVVNYAREKKVIITSPSTLPPMLVTINMLRIEVERAKNAQIISKQLAKLGKDFELFARDWNSFSNKLETASRARESLDKRVNRITTKFDSISGNDVAALDEDLEQIDIE